MMTRWACVALSVALAGCATAPIILRNPAGMAAQCGPYFHDAYTNSTAVREAQCIADYQRQGYERVPSP